MQLKKTELNFRNSLLMLTKNVPEKDLYRILFIRMVLDGIAGIQFVVQGKVKHFLAILKAHFVFYTRFSENYAKRSNFQQKEYYIVKSIVYNYFVKKIRFFNDLITLK